VEEIAFPLAIDRDRLLLFVSLGLDLSGVDYEAIRLGPNPVGFHGFGSRPSNDGPRLKVELGTVPRARDRGAGHRSFVERTPHMRALRVHTEEEATDVEHRDRGAVHQHASRLARIRGFSSRDFHRLPHFVTPIPEEYSRARNPPQSSTRPRIRRCNARCTDFCAPRRLDGTPTQTAPLRR